MPVKSIYGVELVSGFTQVPLALVESARKACLPALRRKALSDKGSSMLYSRVQAVRTAYTGLNQ
jgi:hypothetical protein